MRSRGVAPCARRDDAEVDELGPGAALAVAVAVRGAVVGAAGKRNRHAVSPLLLKGSAAHTLTAAPPAASTGAARKSNPGGGVVIAAPFSLSGDRGAHEDLQRGRGGTTAASLP